MEAAIFAMAGRVPAAPGSGEGVDERPAPAGEAATSLRPSRGRLPRPSATATLAALLGTAVTVVLALTVLALYESNENRLLRLRARELSSVLSTAVPAVQTPLAAAAALADDNGGNPQRFRAFIAPYVGPGRQFASVSLWPLGVGKPAPSVVAGTRPVLASQPEEARRVFAEAKRGTQLKVTAITGSASPPGLGYAYATPGATGGFAAYAESALPKDRRSRIASSSAFSDLNYVLYLGATRSPKHLLLTSLSHFPVTGRQSSDVVPFGDSEFTLVVTPRKSLSGGFFASLPWIVALVGALITLAAAVVTERLARRRRDAERLAGELDRVAIRNRDMYTEQRSIAGTLQHALLPESLPTFRGVEVSALYIPAASGLDVGGDWYDVVPMHEDRVLVMIGDVSGHGLRAATTMASLRHAALAFASEDSRPGSVLARLSDFVNTTEHSYFATMLCMLIDIRARRLTVASAGHVAPLLLDGEDGRFVKFEVNVPIGVQRDSPYRESSVPVAPHSTLIAFTDGLVERRGEPLDAGLARLREAATERRAALDELLGRIARSLASHDHHDDTAIVGIRWRS
jgi:serine phosphatase RsbU (regulator of sigma subunit)